MKAVIFDLDQTLVDSGSVKALRDSRQWGRVYSMIPSLKAYEGVADILSWLEAEEVPFAIVTSSPRPYCDNILAHHKWTVRVSVCAREAPRYKPDPAPLLHAANLLQVPPQDIISIGDDAKDIIASNAAKMYSVAATWGSTDRAALLSAGPHSICENVQSLDELLKRMLKEQ